MITCGRNFLGMGAGESLQTMMQVWHLQKEREKKDEWIEKVFRLQKPSFKKFLANAMSFPPRVSYWRSLYLEEFTWACLVPLSCSVMACELPGECVSTVWRQQWTQRCAGGVSKLCSPLGDWSNTLSWSS